VSIFVVCALLNHQSRWSTVFCEGEPQSRTWCSQDWFHPTKKLQVLQTRAVRRQCSFCEILLRRFCKL